jgi:dihydropyrimidinase
MPEYDTVIRNGILVTHASEVAAEIGITNGKIAAIGSRLDGDNVLDASGLLVMPGGVDTHCHIEQLRPDGSTDEESFVSASISALGGGTTTAVTFSIQFKGHKILPTLTEYRRRAQSSMIDYAFHQIITDPTDDVIHNEIPALAESGIRSLKVFLTYDPLRLDDRGYLRVLAAARRSGMLVTVHCENHDAIEWMSEALLAAGMTAPKFHAWARPAILEREATYRAIALAELVDQPIQIFHVSCGEVAEEIGRAQSRGLMVWAETCPQYLTLKSEDMDRPGFEGAMFMCSPPPRDESANIDLWRHINAGTICNISSDHAGFSFDGPFGKRSAGENAHFPDIPNGIPGVAARMPLLFSEGVATGRISPSDFVRLTAYNPARLFGLHSKGSLDVGADADLVFWDPGKTVTLTNRLMQHAIDYTPYEGRTVTGWPVLTMLRGNVVMRHGVVTSTPGSGRYIARPPYEFIKPKGRRLTNGFNPSAFA